MNPKPQPADAENQTLNLPLTFALIMSTSVLTNMNMATIASTYTSIMSIITTIIIADCTATRRTITIELEGQLWRPEPSGCLSCTVPLETSSLSGKLRGEPCGGGCNLSERTFSSSGLNSYQHSSLVFFCIIIPYAK